MMINHYSMIVKNPKKIGLDLDGVIIDLSLDKIILAKKFGIDIVLSQTPANVFVNAVPKAIREKIQMYLYERPETARQLPLMSHAILGLEKIKKSGNLLYLISQRKNREIAVNLLKTKNLWPKFFSENNTFFVKDEVEKARIGKELGIDYYVDDWLPVLNLFSFVKKKFLFDPLKVYPDKGGDYKIINSWDELMLCLIN